MTTPLDVRIPRGAVTLSATELLACWEALRLGDPPTLLQLRRPGVTIPAQQAAEPRLRAALTRLTERGLIEHHRPGHAHPAGPLTRMLRTVAGAAHHLDIRCTHPDGTNDPVLGIAALNPPYAIILVTTTHAATPFRLWTVDSTRAATALLGLLGDIHPGQGRSVNIPAAVFDQALRAVTEPSMWTLADELRARGIPATDATALAHMCNHATTGAQLGATTRTHHTEHRGTRTLGVHHNRLGHYLHRRHAGTLTIAPTDRPRLHHEWHTLLERLTAATTG